MKKKKEYQKQKERMRNVKRLSNAKSLTLDTPLLSTPTRRTVGPPPFIVHSIIPRLLRLKFLRPGVNYQAINADILRAHNLESWPFFNQPRRGYFEIRVEDGKTFASLQDLKRPFKAMKDLDMDDVGGGIVKDIGE